MGNQLLPSQNPAQHPRVHEGHGRNRASPTRTPVMRGDLALPRPTRLCLLVFVLRSLEAAEFWLRHHVEGAARGARKPPQHDAVSEV